jgi:hypothetical protein
MDGEEDRIQETEEGMIQERRENTPTEMLERSNGVRMVAFSR